MEMREHDGKADDHTFEVLGSYSDLLVNTRSKTLKISRNQSLVCAT